MLKKRRTLGTSKARGRQGRAERRPTAALPALRVGIDLASVTDAAHALERFGQRYLTRVFTAREAAECMSTPAQSAARLAARFAAKEAAIKVLRPPHWIDWRNIEVLRHATGFTQLALRGDAAALAHANGLANFEVSLAHEGNYATAVVVACCRQP